MDYGQREAVDYVEGESVDHGHREPVDYGQRICMDCGQVACMNYVIACVDSFRLIVFCKLNLEILPGLF